MIFVDTSAIYALADRRDTNHLDAAHRFDTLLQSGRRPFTHSYVLVESMALLDRRLGAGRAKPLVVDHAALVGTPEHEQPQVRLR